MVDTTTPVDIRSLISDLVDHMQANDGARTITMGDLTALAIGHNKEVVKVDDTLPWYRQIPDYCLKERCAYYFDKLIEDGEQKCWCTLLHMPGKKCLLDKFEEI